MSEQGSNDYSVEVLEAGKQVRLKGILRLMSPAAYKPVFGPIQDQMLTCAGRFTLDIAGLQFMNSSGITALSRLLLVARERNLEVLCLINASTPWQKKTLGSLQHLLPKLTLQTV